MSVRRPRQWIIQSGTARSSDEIQEHFSPTRPGPLGVSGWTRDAERCIPCLRQPTVMGYPLLVRRTATRKGDLARGRHYPGLYSQHSTATVKPRARSATAWVVSFLARIWPGHTETPWISRNIRATEPLIAKLTFCGIVPVALATPRALSRETTTPMTLPDSSSKGPPLLPGWTGAVIWRRVESILQTRKRADDPARHVQIACKQPAERDNRPPLRSRQGRPDVTR